MISFDTGNIKIRPKVYQWHNYYFKECYLCHCLCGTRKLFRYFAYISKSSVMAKIGLSFYAKLQFFAILVIFAIFVIFAVSSRAFHEPFAFLRRFSLTARLANLCDSPNFRYFRNFRSFVQSLSPT